MGARCAGAHFALEWYRHRTDGAFFENRFKDGLLKAIPAGYTIIMDNARFPRKAGLRTRAGGNVGLLVLPPYSPDYHPIEKTRATMKRCLRNTLQHFKSVDAAIYDYFSVPLVLLNLL